MFGVDRHPAIAGGKVPLLIELLAPAHRPVQMTRDLPGFWRGSYAAVRAEMRGRYPKHPWPDNPLAACRLGGQSGPIGNSDWRVAREANSFAIRYSPFAMGAYIGMRPAFETLHVP